MAWLSQQLAPYRDLPVRVLEIGSRDINGSPRSLFTNAKYVGIDLQPGPGVDFVADAVGLEMRHSSSVPKRMQPTTFHIVICAEVFEHAPRWRDICVTARRHLVEGGLFVGTAAGEGRAPHSASDGRPLGAWANSTHVLAQRHGAEWYENIDGAELHAELHDLNFDRIVIDHNDTARDIYWSALR